MDYTGRKTIYDYLRYENIEDGTHSMKLGNNEVITFDIINYNEDTVFTETPTLGDTTTDGNMLILKINGNLEIGAGVTITPQVRRKGFTIYCTGTITNNGIISMTARGASAKGQNIMLYDNENGTFEIVPAVGGAATARTTRNGHGVTGNKGKDRGTGGGGAGGLRTSESSSGGAGGAGTSYSGGCGGGGASSYEANVSGGNGSSTGGAGGNGACRRTTANNWNATGGAGNPAGKNSRKGSGAGYGSATAATSDSGTGGLLIIYCNTFNNEGNITANGSSSRPSGYNNTTHCATGGSSGGGSINIFYSSVVKYGNITATGGISVSAYRRGGNGGDGCVTLQCVDKCVLKENDNYYSIKPKYYDTTTSMYIPITETLSTDLIIDEGFCIDRLFELVTIGGETFRPIDKFNTFSLIHISENPLKVFGCKSSTELIVTNSKGTIDTSITDYIDYIKLNATKSNGGDIKIAISLDWGTTWNTYDAETSSFVPLDGVDIPYAKYANMTEEQREQWHNAKRIILEQGMSTTRFNSLDFNNLMGKYEKIRIAYVLDIKAYGDLAELNELNWQYDARGVMRKMTNNEFEVYSCVSDIIVTSLVDTDILQTNILV